MLVCLCVCVLHVHVASYSRGVLHERYSQLSTVLCAELIKLCIATAMILRTHSTEMHKDEHTHRMRRSRIITFITHIGALLIARPGLAIPGGVYLLQNMLQALALQYLPAGTHGGGDMLACAYGMICHCQHEMWSEMHTCMMQSRVAYGTCICA